MKRTLLVLALALVVGVGCQAVNPNCGQPCAPACGQACAPTCGQACGGPCGPACGGSCCEPCHVATMKYAPRPGGCCEGCGEPCGRSGNLEANCPGGNGCVFDRYCGQECGPQYPAGPYDCSPCGSPDWGCTGHRHPFGYKTSRECYCSNDNCGQQQECVCPHCGRHYCCLCGGPPSPGCDRCPFCGCGPSGDQHYNFNPGPPVAQTAYPYYTLRGPRDFLLNNPPSIGPY
jgi:hypothetical protein